MTFTEDAWAATADLRAEIDALPFLTMLRDGSLPRETFTEYLGQDAAYLAEYARVLAAAASQTRGPDELAFWAGSAQNVVVVERALHETYLDGRRVEPSSTCAAYTSYLLSLVAGGSYPVLVAGALPCFWVYEDVGRRLRASLEDEGGSEVLASHPYGDWIGTYGDADFAAATEQAKALVDGAAEESSPAVLARMHEAFRTATRHELRFWEAPVSCDRGTSRVQRCEHAWNEPHP